MTVIGIGGLGHLAIQFAAKMGAEVSEQNRAMVEDGKYKQIENKHSYKLLFD